MRKNSLYNDEPLYSNILIRVDVTNRLLYLERGNRTTQIYPVAVGKPSTPTPPGTYSIIEKTVNPGGILGTRWMGLDIPDGPYGIHGTWNRDSIGKAVSNGCIRMYNEDVEEVFRQVHIGTTVIIYR
ncbi:L,D-transpeptidase [Thermincola ferriacetica]